MRRRVRRGLGSDRTTGVPGLGRRWAVPRRHAVARGEPDPEGDLVRELHLSDRQARRLQLVIKDPETYNRGKPYRTFDGTARLCIERPLAQNFAIGGKIAHDVYGDRGSYVSLSRVGEWVDGLHFSRLDVTWEKPRFTVAGVFVDRYDNTTGVSSDNPDHLEPTRVELEKGTDAAFTAACDALAS